MISLEPISFGIGGSLAFTVCRQPESHMRLTRVSSKTDGEQHVTTPNHDPPRIGTLAAILDSVARYHGMSKDQLLQKRLG